MNKINYFLLPIFLLSVSATFSQDKKTPPQKGHINNSQFKQLYEEFSTPNMYRTGSGAPGPAYYQQQADYKIDVELDDKNKKIYGEETITYTNNSPDDLEYLWVQLDQNVRTKNTPSALRNGTSITVAEKVETFTTKYLAQPFDGGFNIQYVKDNNDNDLSYTVNQTMMRVNIPKPLKAGDKISFKIKWWYNIVNHVDDRSRSGYEYFPEDGNRSYVIAQFFPRMAVYNDVEGWQNHQFWGNGEFALPFGNYEVNITVPADHILDGTGVLQNRKEVFTEEMIERYEEAKTSFDKPVLIVTQEEATAKESLFSEEKNTWKFKAENVRDFAFASSRKYIWDMQAVKIGDRTVMAVSMYSKEGNPLWEEYSTKVVAHTLKTYSKYTFDYPYHKAISVHAKEQGMEYPMICWNYGRPNLDGTYSDRVKYGMISVIIHEVGHNFFPMIVNSDERQWGWMDEGLDTFMQYLTEQEFQPGYPSRRGDPVKIVDYMKGDQNNITPIMSNPENVYQLGANAYGKPATALNILRNTVMGPELFDHAFKTYAQRWMFKHPTPEDFFRTMEDASSVDLDWFWRGWFYTTDYVDIGIKGVRKFHVSSKPNEQIRKIATQQGIAISNLIPLVYLVEEGSEDYNNNVKNSSKQQNFKILNEYLMDNFTAEERSGMKQPKYFYEMTFEKPGGLPMPLIVEYTYRNGKKEIIKYPAEIWRKNSSEYTRVIASEDEIISVIVDPKAETADVDITNNSWPKKVGKTDFDKFKEKVKG